ncbi:MAG: 2-C-methyl-D-erythritol 4-phosphate cytidylyltransferase [Clostridia bacterium]|nr:2-C-methyl-D-erythritol 4-phosphate cytidylyltransferase [Clostridia bacterium]
MNVAIIFAGGVGRRMNTKSTPKQFLTLHEKPILIHTLEVFQNCADIDAICIACLESHIDYTRALCEKFCITKVKWIVPGGATGQQSIFNGVKTVYDNCPADSIVLLHDGVRPNIDTDLVSRNIEAVKQYGTAVSCAAATETPAEIDENGNIYTIYVREKAVIAKAPQSFYLGELYDAHLKARAEEKEFIDSASLMRNYGHTLHTVECKWDNIKITNPSDFYIFKAILEAKENSQIFGL